MNAERQFRDSRSIEESEAPPAIVNPHGYGIFELSWSRPPAEANNGPFVMANSNPGPSSQPALDAGETDVHGYGIFEPAWSRPVAAVVRNEPFVMADPNLRAPPEPSPNVEGKEAQEQIQNADTTTAFGTKLADALRVHDETKIENCNSDIDTLLVFAGLFSAIIAAFIIESYKMLQQNSSDLSAQILAQISAKFDALSGNSSVSTSIPPVPSFVTPSSAVRVNALWFAGLISSLVTASLAMFVKQWLRQYLTWGCTSPAERIRIRYVRYEGLVRWKVFEIAAILPLLLQLALLLFLAGLSEFLRPLNFTVWLSTTVLAISWFVIYLNSVMAPAVSIICPYKTPLLINALNQARGVLARLRYGMAWKERTGSKNKYYQFPGDERGVRRDTDFDVPAIISADKILADDATLVDIIRNCVDQTIGPETVTIAREILAHRLDGYPISFTDPSINFDRVPSRVLNVVVGALSNTIRKEFAAGRDIRWHPWLNEAFVGLCSLLNHIQSETRMVDMAEGVSVISGAFALPPRIVKNVLIVLATDSPWVTWKLSNQATSPAACRTLINAADDLLEITPLLDPVRLLGETMAVLSAMPTGALQGFAPDLYNLTSHFSNNISARRISNASTGIDDFMIAPGRGDLSTYKRYLLDECLDLSQRVQRSVNPELIDVLQVLPEEGFAVPEAPQELRPTYAEHIFG